MRDETKVIGDCAVVRLNKLLAEIKADTAQVSQTNDIPATVVHYAYLRNLYDALKACVSALDEHVDSLSYQILPMMMGNQNVQTITLPDVGRVSINVRWSAKMLNKDKGMEWMRQTGNDGLIIETVNSSTLTSFAQAETLAGRPLPEDLFKVGTYQYVSLTRGVS
jgi:hypothetical protein